MRFFKDCFFLAMLTCFSTFVVFGQQSEPSEKFSLTAVSDVSLNASVDVSVRIHSLDLQSLAYQGSESGARTLDEAKAKAKQIYTALKDVRPDPSFELKKLGFDFYHLTQISVLKSDKERNYATTGFAEYYGRDPWSTNYSFNGSQASEFVVPTEKRGFKLDVSVGGKSSSDFTLYLAKFSSQAQKTDYEVESDFENYSDQLALRPGNYFIDVKVGEILASADSSKIVVSLNGVKITDRFVDKDGNRRLVFSLNTDYVFLSGSYMIMGKPIFKDDGTNIPAKYSFQITSDPFAIQEFLVREAADSDLPALSQWEVDNALQEGNSTESQSGGADSKDKKVYKPFSSMTLLEAYQQAMDYDTTFNFNISDSEKESGGKILIDKKKIPNPTSSQKYIQAVREKLKEWIASKFAKKQNQEVIRHWAYYLAWNENESPIVMASIISRYVAEWRDSDPNWSLNVGKKVRDLFASPVEKTGVDSFVGVDYRAYSSDPLASNNLTSRVGFGLSSGLSYVYAVGAVGFVSGKDTAKIIANTYYLGGLEASYAFSSFIRGVGAGYYHSSGNIEALGKAELMLLENNLSLGIFLDYNTLATRGVVIGADVGLFKFCNLGVSFASPSAVTSVYFRVKG